jgi:Leucine-rich repeat (LRR) protein
MLPVSANSQLSTNEQEQNPQNYDIVRLLVLIFTSIFVLGMHQRFCVAGGSRMRRHMERRLTLDISPDRQVQQLFLREFGNHFMRNPQTISISGRGVNSIRRFDESDRFLRMVAINDTSIRKVPKGLESLTHLQYLFLNHNSLEKLSKRVFELENLRTLSVCGNHLQAIPDSFERLTGLADLDLSNNLLSYLPGSLTALRNLVHLRVSHNRLEDLVDLFQEMESMQSFDVSDNQIKAVPDSLFRPSLILLNLGENRISSLPSALGACTELRYLDLSSNQLEELPAEVGQLRSLINCNLSFNQLNRLPPQTGNLTSLTALDITENPHLSSLPFSLAGCRSLQLLRFDPFRIPVRQVEAISMRISAQSSGIPLEMDADRTVALWADLAKKEPPSAFSNLALNEKAMVLEWLLRLEKTVDFTEQKTQVALVCIEILEALQDPSFKESFFLQIEDNLSDCEDRALLNLILLHMNYALHSKGGSSPMGHLKLLASCARTLQFLKTIPEKIFNGNVHDEDTEIYLYLLHKHHRGLNLLIPFEVHMRFERYAVKRLSELEDADVQGLVMDIRSKDPLEMIFEHLPEKAFLWLQENYPEITSQIEEQIGQGLEEIEKKAESLGSQKYLQELDALGSLKIGLLRNALQEKIAGAGILLG